MDRCSPLLDHVCGLVDSATFLERVNKSPSTYYGIPLRDRLDAVVATWTPFVERNNIPDTMSEEKNNVKR